MGLFKKSNQSKAQEAGVDAQPPQEPPPGYSLEPGVGETSAPSYQPPNYPPPSGSHFDSLYSNAPDDERDMGEMFCNQHSLFPPLNMAVEDLERATADEYTLIAPPAMTVPKNSKLTTWKRFKGDFQNERKDKTVFIRSKKDTKDCIFVSDKPFYAPRSLRNARIYYEVTITSLPHPDDAAIAIGFTCLPYPPFRLPGWHRGSLAVHSDDGRRYVNDSLSGKDFVRPFQEGETIGIGVDYARQVVLLTRNGMFENEWSLVQDMNTSGTDPYRGFRDGGVHGITGESDVYAAVGVYGSVGVIVNFDRSNFKAQIL
jgi:hypothetical protein